MKRLRCFDPAATVPLSDVPLPSVAGGVVARQSGQYSACDVYIRYETLLDGGIGLSTWTLYAVTNGVEAPVDSQDVASAVGVSSGGFRTIRLLTARACPCDGFVVRSTAIASGSVDLVFELFGDDDGPSDGASSGAASASDTNANPTSATEVISYGHGWTGAVWARLRAGVVAVTSTFLGFLNTLPFGRYVAGRPVLADGEGAALPLSSAGFLQVAEQYAAPHEDNANAVACVVQKPAVLATYVWTRYMRQGDAVSGVIKAGAGNLQSIAFQNAGATTRHLWLFDKASAPIAGDVPVAVFVCVTATGRHLGAEYFGPNGTHFATGIAWAWSSLPTGGYVVAGPAAADHILCAMYK